MHIDGKKPSSLEQYFKNIQLDERRCHFVLPVSTDIRDISFSLVKYMFTPRFPGQNSLQVNIPHQKTLYRIIFPAEDDSFDMLFFR